MRFDLKYVIGGGSLLLGIALILSAYQLAHSKLNEVTIPLLIGLGVLFIELFLIYLIIEYLLYVRDRRRWNYAYTTVSRSIAMIFVDLMRLLYLSTVSSNSSEGRRLEEFIALPHDRLKDLRSFIEGFASVLDAESHTTARRLETILQWYFRTLSTQGELDRIRGENEYALRYFGSMRDLSKEVFAYINCRSNGQLADEIQSVGILVSGRAGRNPVSFENAKDRAEFMRARFSLQASLPDSAHKTGALSVKRPMIRYDVEGAFAMKYFLIDYFLLQSTARDVS